MGWHAEMDAKIQRMLDDPEGYWREAYAEARRMVEADDAARLKRLIRWPWRRR